MPTFATSDEKEKFYRGAVFAGADGAPITITDITISEGKDNLQLHLTSEVASKLRDGYNPAAGAEAIDAEPISMLVTLRDDMQQTLDTFNRGFGLSPPLIDDGEWLDRFAEDHPQSVYGQIVGKAAYVFAKATPKPSRQGDDIVVYWNLHAPSRKHKPTLAQIKALRAKKGGGDEVPAAGTAPY